MRILICGDRNWIDESRIEEVIVALPKNTVIIHGACSGADNMAGRVARSYGLKVEQFPADWVKYGKSAGPIRNQEMIAQGNPNLVIAFHNNLATSRGTLDMIRTAEKSGILVILVTSRTIEFVVWGSS